jgi:hypothetical protein
LRLVECNGNVATSREAIRMQAGITVGKPLDEIQVDNARLRLATLPNFRVIQTFNSSPGNVLLFTVGRNSEDDPSFPTHGWLLHPYDGWGPSLSDFAGVVIRGTWRACEDAYWTFQARPFDDFRSLFDDDLGISIVYSHDYEVGLKAGVRLETKYLGTVNLYLIATHFVTGSGY